MSPEAPYTITLSQWGYTDVQKSVILLYPYQHKIANEVLCYSILPILILMFITRIPEDSFIFTLLHFFI